MTKEQKAWLAEHPDYSPVRYNWGVSLTGWTKQGYLFADGRFVEDDGTVLFPHKYPSWFAADVAKGNPVRVGRHYYIP